MATKKSSVSAEQDPAGAALSGTAKKSVTRKTASTAAPDAAAEPAPKAPVKKAAARKSVATDADASASEPIAKVAKKPATRKVKPAPAQTDETSAGTVGSATEKPATKKPAARAKKKVEQIAPLESDAPQQENAEAQALQQVDLTPSEVHLAPAPETLATESAESGELQGQGEHDEQTAEERAEESAEESAEDGGYDLGGKSREELIALLEELLADRPVQSLRREAEAVKVAFYKLHRTAVEQQKKLFVEAGGVPEEFVSEVDPIEQKFKEVFALYRRKRDEHAASIERAKNESLAIKTRIIEELKELITKGETLGHTFNAFRDLQRRWRETGPVPQTATKDIWETYNHHVEQFYNYININKELRDLDLRRNYETKVAMCEEAEALLLEPSVVAAFNRLQKLHERWRDTGPVTAEYKEAIWERFRQASSRINKLHQDYFEKLKEDQKRNFDLKTELCIKTEELAEAEYASRREWNKASDRLAEIQKLWKTIGFAPKKDNTHIYDRFRQACDRFFESKRNFYAGVKDEEEENLQLKIELCIMVEGLQESDQWSKTSDEIIALQKRWKEIGPVSRRHADAIWKRFRAACDHFFDRKAQQFSGQEAQQHENLERKRALLAEMAAVDMTALNFDTLKDFQRRWGEIGFVPIKQKETLGREYKKLVDGMFDALRADGRQQRMGNYRNRINDMRSSGTGRLQSERDKLFSRVRQLEADIALLENNIGFFAKSRNSEKIIADVRQQIDKARGEMAAQMEKIRMIDREQE
ncbi:hypothetical protein FACS1894159_11210 [Bacteroidia bacterium]|nr:hypothetical protein FACS1894159_11210 [Bacteroidia bacterium]